MKEHVLQHRAVNDYNNSKTWGSLTWTPPPPANSREGCVKHRSGTTSVRVAQASNGEQRRKNRGLWYAVC